nr:MFS transporter [Brachybacterium equifaecis]
MRDPRYRNLFAAQAVALVGTGLLTVALGLLAYDIAGPRAGAVLGTALTIKMVAYVAVAPVIAAVVSRLPTKAVLVGADLIRLAVAASLPFLTDIWQIYVLVFVLQSASATFTPAFQSLIPVVLPDEKDYTKALSLSRLAYDLESLVSPLLAAALLSVIEFDLLFAGTAVGFALSAVCVLATPLPARTPVAAAGSVWHRTTLGARIFARTPSLRFLMAMNLVVAAGTALVVVNSVVYVRDVFHLGSSSLGFALACCGTGSLLVALAVPRLLERVSDRRLMLVGAGLSSAALIGAVGMTAWAASGRGDGAWWLLLPLWLAIGAGNSMIGTPSGRLLARASDDSTRSSLYTAQFSLSHACFLLTYPLAGWIGAESLTAAAAVLAAIAIAGGVAARSERRGGSRGRRGGSRALEAAGQGRMAP